MDYYSPSSLPVSTQNAARQLREAVRIGPGPAVRHPAEPRRGKIRLLVLAAGQAKSV